MSNTEVGQRAEAAAADFLVSKGCTVVERNWRTRVCEIDIVAQRGGMILFCEVKYRQSTQQGQGIDYITPKKLHQMRFAAESWVQANDYSGGYELCAIEVSGDDFRITNAVHI